MANTITGRILSIGQVMQVAGKDPSRPLLKREVIMDCTRHDPYTGERAKYENTPALEFVGDAVHELDAYRSGDIVTVSFSVEGRKYTGKDGQTRIFTSVRPYRIERNARQAEVQQQLITPEERPLPFPPKKEDDNALPF